MGVAIAGAIPGIVAGSTTALVVGTVINIVIAAVLGKILAPDVSDGRDTRALQRTLRNTIMPRRVIYGECLAGGPYVVIETTGKQNEELIFVIVLASHPVEDIIGVIMHDEYMDISGRWPTAGSQGDSDLDSNYYIDNGPFGSTFSSDKRFEMIEIIKSNGWGYADFQYVTAGGGQDPLDDRARAGEMESSMGGTDWTIPTSTVRDSGTGLYDNDTAPVQRAKLTNLAHIFLNFRYEPDIFSGWPAPNFHVKGKRLYNPNLDSSLTSYGAAGGSHDLDDPDTWEWSEDWTLCCLDYLINTAYGLGAKASTSNPEDVTLNEIDWAAMIQSYQESSEVTTNGLPTGHKDFGSAARYTINGLFELGDTPISIMESLLASGSGELIYSQGVYKIRPGVYRLPNSENDIINEDMMVGPLTIQTHTPRSDLFNKAAGVFVDKGFDESISKGVTNLPLFVSADFELVDPLDSSGTNPFEVIDGEEIIEHFDYPFTIRNYEAQRLARIQLERVRRGFTVSFEATLEVLKYSVGDTVYLEILNNSKYSSEVFYNRLGLDDSVQDRPDSPFTPYYKQFKIITMEYTEDFTIAMTMIEESETIYDWNDGMASPDEDNLVSDLVIEDPLGLVEVPYFVVASPDQTITEIENISGMSILVRWTAPERGSVVNQIDKAHIDNYVLEFGIVDNPSEADPADRVSAWSPGGIFTPTDRTLTTQGPITISNLFIDPDTDYDFRLRSVTFSGRSSVWAYYSTDIGSDFTPAEPNNANRYYIKPTNGTAIKNSVGTLTVEAREVGILGDVLLTSGDIKLYVGSLEVTTGNGYPSPSDGYTGTFGDTEILGNVVVELRNDSLGQLFDTITLADITDGGTGSDSTFGYIEAKDTLAWVKNQDGVWDPSATSTNMDVTFTRGGSDVARWSYAIDLGGVPEGLQDGGSTTHTGGNLNTGHITPTVTFAPFDRACLMEYHYNDGAGNVSYVAENVTVTYGGLQRYYILPSNTAIRNGVGTITLEARLVDELGDNLITSGDIKLFDENFNVIETASPGNYPSPSDGYTGTLTGAEIDGSEIVYLGDPNSPTTYFDTVTLVDVIDGEAGVVGWIEPEFLAWRRDINGGAWVPSQTTAQFDIIFNIGGTDVARQGYEITRTGAGTLTGATNTASSPGNLNTSRITLDITGSGTTNLTVKADYSFDALNGSVSETIFTVTGGDDSIFYYILPLNGNAIQNGVGTLQIEAHEVIGAVDNALTSGTIQLYDENDDLVHTDSPGNYPSPSDGYFGTFNRIDIAGSSVITLKDGPSGQPLDTITLVDTLDGATAPDYARTMIYDDLDTTQLAAGASRYAILSARGTNTSGMQSGFETADGILINKEDRDGSNHGLYYKGLFLGSQISYVISTDRWFTYKIDETYETIGSGATEAYKFGVTLVDYRDLTPSDTISTSAGTDVEFQFVEPLDPDGSLVLDPDFDLLNTLPVVTNEDSAGFWDNSSYWVATKEMTAPSSSPSFGNWGWTLNVGSGPNNSNTVTLQTSTPQTSGFTEAWLVSRKRIRTNTPSFLMKLRALSTTPTSPFLDVSISVQARGYSTPTSPDWEERISLPFEVAYTDGTTFDDYEFLLESASNVDAQYWEFRIGFIHFGATFNIGEMEIDSIFVYPSSRTFGTYQQAKYTGDPEYVPGLVPGSDTVADAGKFLRADGTWQTAAGGGANLFETFTVTDTDSGYSWSETGSAVAASATDTLTFVSGENINIDIDATTSGDAIRISNPASGFQGLGVWRHRTETATPPGSGQIRFNNGTPTSATSFYVHETNDSSTNMANFLALLDDGALIYLQDRSDANNFFIIEISSYTDSGTYVTFGIQNIVLEGTEPSQNQQMLLIASESGSTAAEVNDLTAAVTWDNIPFANVPTGTSSSTVAIGDHTHTAESLTDFNSTGKVSGSLMVWNGTDTWVDTGADVTWISGGGTLSVDGSVSAQDRLIVSNAGLNSFQIDNDSDWAIFNALNLNEGIKVTNCPVFTGVTTEFHGELFRSYNGTDYVQLRHNGTNVAEIEFDSTSTRLNIGLSSSAFREIRMAGGIKMQEQVAPVAQTTAYGQIWVKTAVPNELWFTNDAGGAVQLGLGGGFTPPIDLDDNEEIRFGTSQDVLMDWDGTDFEIRFAAASRTMNLRDGVDLRIYDTTDTDWISISTTTVEATIDVIAGNDLALAVAGNERVTIKSAGAVWLGYGTDEQVFRTTDPSSIDSITGAEIKHWDGSYYHVGMARMPKVNLTGALTVSDTHWHKRIVHNGTIDASFNLTFNTESSQPQDVVLWVMAKNGPIVLVDGSMVLHFYDGSGAPATGNITVARGGWATVVKDTDSAAHVTGVGLS